MKNDNIIMRDWAGNVLFKGHKDDSAVDKVLEANQCHCFYDNEDSYLCRDCDGTGYIGDFEVFWEDENRKDNVYELINY